MQGKGRRQVTGRLGDVMKESIQAAVSYVRYNAPTLGIIPPEFEKKDIYYNSRKHSYSSSTLRQKIIDQK